jgi:iron complex outermembrane receptor protein
LRGSFAAAETIPDLALGKYGHRQDSPIDLLKTRRFMSISKGFSTPTVSETLTQWEINTSLKPEIGWNYELGLKLHGLNNKYTEADLLSTQITNLLVARRTRRSIYRNKCGEFAYWDGISAELSTVTNESIQTIKLFFGCGQSLHI